MGGEETREHSSHLVVPTNMAYGGNSETMRYCSEIFTVRKDLKAATTSNF